MLNVSVSFILPVYNAAASVSRAIRSIIALQLPDYEIICVDDASTDHSLAVVTALAVQHPRITVLPTAQNGGVSLARNRGLAHASKQFVYFIDADDCCTASFFDQVDPACELVIGQHAILRPQGAQTSIDFGFGGMLERPQIRALMQAYLRTPHGNSMIVHCWGKLYRREFIQLHQLKFNEAYHIYEDIDFVARTIHLAMRVSVSPVCTYHKHLQPQSLSQGFANTPLNYQNALRLLAADAGTNAADTQRLYQQANSHYLIRSLHLAKQLPLARISHLMRLLRDELGHVDARQISDPTIAFVVRYRLFMLPWLAACILISDR